MKKKTLLDLQNMKGVDPITWITAYDLPFAQSAEKAGIDMILVGDSGGMVQLGYETTNPVTMDEMITMAKSARKGAPNTFIVGDMPQGSYEVSNELAVVNALRFVKEANVDAIKLEGGCRVQDRVRAIVNAGVPVVGHLGLTPQSTASFGGYRVQGKTRESFNDTYEDALALQKAGMSLLLLEAMPAPPAKKIAEVISVPVLGIGAGKDIDGQLVIMHDLMGFYQSFRPWFAKCYIPCVANKFVEYLNDIVLANGSENPLKDIGRSNRGDGLLKLAEMAISEYIKETKAKVFPDQDYTYPIKAEELDDISKSRYW